MPKRLPPEIPLVDWPEIGIYLSRPTSKAAIARAWALQQGQSSGGTSVVKGVERGWRNTYIVRDREGRFIATALSDVRGAAMGSSSFIIEPQSRTGSHKHGEKILPAPAPDGTFDAILWFALHVLGVVPNTNLVRINGLDRARPSFQVPWSPSRGLFSIDRERVSESDLVSQFERFNDLDNKARHLLVNEYVETIRAVMFHHGATHSGQWSGWDPSIRNLLRWDPAEPIGLALPAFTGLLYQEKWGFRDIPYKVIATVLTSGEYDIEIRRLGRLDGAEERQVLETSQAVIEDPDAGMLLGSGPMISEAMAAAELIGDKGDEATWGSAAQIWTEGHAQQMPGRILDPLDSMRFAFGQGVSFSLPQNQWIWHVQEYAAAGSEFPVPFGD